MLSPTEVLYPHGAGYPHLVADVDWATGVVRMHIPFEEWQHVTSTHSSKLTDEERGTLEVVSHEYVHVLQLTTTGYAYNLSSRCFEQVARALSVHNQLDAVYENRERFATPLEPEYQRLGEIGDGGVRAIDIIESMAFLVQKRLHWPSLGPRTYEAMLDDEVSDVAYRRAYDVAADVLSEDAFEHLAHVATLALATREPQTVFLPLVKEIAASGSRMDMRRNQEVCLRLLNENFRDMLLGHALEQLAAGRAHPVLEPILRGYNELANSGDLKPLAMIASPHAMDTKLAELLVGPTLLPPPVGQEKAGMYLPQAWVDRTEGNPVLEPAMLRFASAASAIIRMDIAPHREERAKPRTRPAAYDMPTTLRNWVISADNRTNEMADHLANLLDELAQKTPEVRMLRGTVAISYPDDEHSGSPYLDPGVRGFLRRVYDRVPYLLYYLAEGEELGPMLGCAAAHAADEAVQPTGDGFSVRMDPEVVKWLMSRLQAAALFALKVGDTPRVLLGHAREVDQISEMLASVVLDPDLPDHAQN